MTIIHIIGRTEWDSIKDKKSYTTNDFEIDGFVHCSNVDQVVRVANFLFKGVNDLVLLVIDSDNVTSNVVWEDLYNANEEFPHIYGELNLDAVIDVIEFPINDEGLYELPSALL